ncbi:MAG: DUF4926 domain-containing protein [Bacilli bacterium]|nr:DUF4926 domain-containing protein [Bacilli bacterium]
MKFKNNDKVITLVDKGNIKKGSIGYVVCDFVKPNEAYDVEFWNDEDTSPYGYETYLASELDKAN